MIAVVRRVFVTDHFTIEAQHRASGPLHSICDRWSGLLVVIYPFRQAEPRMHRLLPDRVAGRRKGRRVERTYCNPADRWVAVSFPIKRGAAIRAEMKSNPNNRCRRRARRPSAPHRAAPALLENLRRNGKQYRCGADTPCSGTDKPDPVHLWQLLEASRSGTARFVPSIFSRRHWRPLWPISSIAVEPLPKKNCSSGPVPTLVPLWRARQKSRVGRPR
jgi:hypothetical protein